MVEKKEVWVTDAPIPGDTRIEELEKIIKYRRFENQS